MSDNFWKKLNYIIGLLPIGALFGLAAFAATIEIKDLDLWLHLAMGKFILANHYVPNTDILSFTIAGKPWINHEWLFQVLLTWIYNNFGSDGLSKMQAVVVVCTMMLLMFLGYNKDKQLSVTFGLLLVYLIYEQRFTIRPDLFSLFFFAVYIFVLALHIDKKWAVPALFVVQILWTNMHGFFFFGPLFVLIGIVSEWIRRHVKLPYQWNQIGGLTKDEYRRLRIILLVTALACLINPCTLKGAWYPIGVFFTLGGDNKIFFKYIQELQKPMQWGNIFTTGGYIHYKLMILLSLITFILNRRKIDISALLFWLVFLVFSLGAVRNAPFFAFASYLVFITNILHFSFQDVVPLRFTAKKFQYLTSAIFKLLILIWILRYSEAKSMQSYYDFEKYERKSEYGGIAQRSYPDRAVDFLVKNKIKGNFFNDFNSGAYLLGQAYPDIRVFIDGRTEVYGGKYFQDYLKIWEQGDSKLFEEMSAKYNMTGALLNSIRQRIPGQILLYLFKSKEWKVVYFDYDAVVFLKDIPQNKEAIEKLAIDLTKWEAKKLDLYKLGGTSVVPYQNYYRAFTLDSMGLSDQALTEAQEALNVMPGYAEPHNLMGKIYGIKKDYLKAFEHFRIAASISSYDKETRFNLAKSLYDLEQYDGAIKEYEIIQHIWPQDPKGYFLLAPAYAKKKDYEKTMSALKQAQKMMPNNVMDVLGVGDIILEHKEYEKAREIYAMAVAANKDSSQAHYKLGLAYKALDQKEKAAEEFKRSLEIAPEDEEVKKALEGLKVKD